MTDDDDVKYINPTNRLKMKVGGGDGPIRIDPAAIKRAEQALENLAADFDKWLQENPEDLRKAFVVQSADGGDTEENRQAFYAVAHDLKGLGSTLGYPLVTRIGGSLSRLTEETSAPVAPHMTTIASHVNALIAVVGQAVQDASDPVGMQLADELEDLVNKALMS